MTSGFLSRGLAAFLLGILAFPALAADSESLVCDEGAEMGTPFKICLTVTAEQKLNTGFDFAAIFKEIRRINSWMSEWQPGTELSKINEAAGASPVKVSKDLIQVLNETLAISRESGGALDPTFNAFWGLYSFKAGEEREPTDEEIRERLPLIDWKNVVIDEAASTVFLKKPGMKLGLGAVGQSYAADRAVEMLKKRDYKGGYVDGSGDTVFWGVKPGGALWTTAVRDPRAAKGNSSEDAIILRIYGSDFAITTCGDDEKFFMRKTAKGERRVHHVIDPKTGRPADKSRQVTVIAKRGFDADGWDTAAFVMGPKAAKAMLEKKGFRAVIVGADGKVTITKGLEKKKTEWGEGYVVVGELK